MPRSICSAPGKVILFGEHAVVFGVTAIAAALSDLRIVVQLDTTDEPAIEVILKDLSPEDTGISSKGPVKIDHSILHNRIPRRSDPLSPVCPSEDILKALHDEFSTLPLPLAQSLMSVCFLTANVMPELLWGVDEVASSTRRGIRVEIKSLGLPIGSGLGSSAAFSVALSGSLLRLRQLMFGDLCSIDVTLEDLAGDGSPDGWSPPLGVLNILNGWAYASEVIIHGEPSGLDNTTSCFGGAVRLNRSLGRFETLPALPELQILITNTKVPRSTKEQVGKVRLLHESMPPVVQPMLDCVEGISQVFLGLLDPDLGQGTGTLAPSRPKDSVNNPKRTDQFIKVMGTLFNINHNILCALGVGHAALTIVKEASMSNGFACKLTGAGGGGCAITLVESQKDVKVAELRSALSGYGYDTFCSMLGGVGVKWHSEYPKAAADPYDKHQAVKNRGGDSKGGDDSDDSSSKLRQLQQVAKKRANSAENDNYLLATIVSILSVVASVAGVGMATGSKLEITILSLAACFVGYICHLIVSAVIRRM